MHNDSVFRIYFIRRNEHLHSVFAQPYFISIQRHASGKVAHRFLCVQSSSSSPMPKRKHYRTGCLDISPHYGRVMAAASSTGTSIFPAFKHLTPSITYFTALKTHKNDSCLIRQKDSPHCSEKKSFSEFILIFRTESAV